jgi:probable phosphoglycerate mutase
MIVLARHGETEWSASGKHTSTSDVPLTQRGRAAALGLRERLACREFALVLASPRRRARDTADLAGFEPEVVPDLAEIDYGDYEAGRRRRSASSVPAGRCGGTAAPAARRSPRPACAPTA